MPGSPNGVAAPPVEPAAVAANARDTSRADDPFDSRQTSSPGSTSSDDPSEFLTWWQAYPRKDAKQDARKAYTAVRKRHSEAVLMEGLRQYMAAKIMEPWRQWMLPGTFLRGERWMDQTMTSGHVSRPIPTSTDWHCTHEPSCGNRSTCQHVEAMRQARAGCSHTPACADVVACCVRRQG